MIVKGALSFFAVIAAAGFSATAAIAEESVLKVRATGEVTGVGAAALNQAIDQALKASVRQVLLDLTGEANLPALAPLHNSPAQYIQSVRVLSQGSKGETTTVEVDALILDQALKIDVVDLLSPVVPSSVHILALVAESPEGRPLEVSRSGVTQRTLARILTERQLPYLPLEEVLPQYDRTHLAGQVSGETEAAARLARENLCSLAIVGVGRADVKPAVGAANLLHCTADVSVRIITAHDAKLVGYHEDTASVDSMDALEGAKQALEDACLKLRDRITTDTVLASLTVKPQHGVIITIPGETTPETYAVINTWLRGHHGDEAIEAHLPGPTRSRFTLQHTGALADLVKSLDNQAVEGVTLRVEQVVGNEITLRVIDSGAGESPR
jgi:hypothetical protein